MRCERCGKNPCENGKKIKGRPLISCPPPPRITHQDTLKDKYIFMRSHSKFKIGQLVKKKGDKGQWHGRVCGFYSTEITKIGCAVESLRELGSVQIYPESALEEWDGA